MHIALSITDRLWVYAEKVKKPSDMVLQYNRDANRLCPHCIPIASRPCANKERVRPSELQEHRMTHRVLGPCCLCPMHASQPDFVEAAIYVLPVGPFSGQYVASCAQDRCGYFGESQRHSTRCYPHRGRFSMQTTLKTSKLTHSQSPVNESHRE